MVGIAVAGLAISAFSAYSGYKAQKEGQRKSDALAAQNYAYDKEGYEKAIIVDEANLKLEREERETDMANIAASVAEQEKRMIKSQGQNMALARAKAAASGVSGASADIYLAALEEAGEDELAWLREVGRAETVKLVQQERVPYERAKPFGDASYGTNPLVGGTMPAGWLDNILNPAIGGTSPTGIPPVFTGGGL